MSIIYKSLKKLQSQTGEPVAEPTADSSGPRVIAFSSSKPMLVVVGVVLLAAALLTAGLFWYRSHRDGQKPVADAEAALKRSGIQFAPADKVEATAPLSNATQFMPAGSETSTSPSAIPAAASKGDRPTTAAPLSNAQAQGRVVSVHRGYEGSARRNAASADRPSGGTDLDRYRSAALQKSRRIGKLAKQIEAALAAGDDRQAAVLIDQMAQLKGPDHPYVVKLNAFRYIQKQEYTKASDLLKSLLAKNPGDLEADINLAVIDINTQRLPQARQRLLRLKAQHSANARITEILDQLN